VSREAYGMHTVVYDHQAFTMQRYGGISRYFVELARALNRVHGFSSSIAAPLHQNEYLRHSGLRGPHCFAGASFRGADRMRALVNRRMLPLVLNLLGADLVHATYYWPTTRRRGNPLVLTVYDMIHELMPGTDHMTAGLKRRAVEEADHVLCISTQTQSDLVRILGVAPAKTSVTHLAHSMPVVRPEELGASGLGERPFILYVGLRGGYKNFGSLLLAFASSAVLKHDFDILCFGGGSLSAAERDTARAIGLNDKQLRHVSGDDSALAQAYTQAQAFVYPSLYEGFGIPPLEAMARGCPVICSDRSSIPEVVGDAAELFDPTDEESIRRSLEAVCLDPVRQKNLRQAGLQRQALYSWERCARETGQVYRRVLAGHSPN
jgi:glycosyltransferase involved in cell wall biosynthesis